MPHTLTSGSWEAAEAPYVRHLLSICDRFAPGTSDLVRAAPRPHRALSALLPYTHDGRAAFSSFQPAVGATATCMLYAWSASEDSWLQAHGACGRSACVPCSLPGMLTPRTDALHARPAALCTQVADTFTLTPPKFASHFGITAGHIHHIDNSFGFDERFPCATPVPGLYSASAGTRWCGAQSCCLAKYSAVCLYERLS